MMEEREISMTKTVVNKIVKSSMTFICVLATVISYKIWYRAE